MTPLTAEWVAIDCLPTLLTFAIPAPRQTSKTPMMRSPYAPSCVKIPAHTWDSLHERHAYVQ